MTLEASDLVFVEQDMNLDIARTDEDFVNIARAISVFVTDELSKVQSFRDVQEMHAKTDAIAQFVKKSIKDRELKLKASNDLTLSIIEIEHWIGTYLHTNSVIDRTILSLPDLGLNATQSSYFQSIAYVPIAEIRQYASEVFESSKQLTKSAVINWGKRLKKQCL